MDYDVFDAPEWHIAFFRILHGLLLTAFVREMAKKYMKKILTKINGQITEKNIGERKIEVPLQFVVYTLTGLSVTFLTPLLFLKLGLYR